MGIIVFLLAALLGSSRIVHAQTYTETVLHSFCSPTSCSDGSQPYSPLIQAADGNFYGTTYMGGAGQKGTVFQMTPAGVVTVLHTFCTSDCSDGALPESGLVQGLDGALYGITAEGNDQQAGVLFKITSTGTYTVLHSFCLTDCLDGDNPSGLLLGSDGNLYGLTAGGGQAGYGTLFEVSTDGDFSVLYAFCSLASCKDGGIPAGSMVQGTDGNLYGVTALGGNDTDSGTVFQYSFSSQKLTPLYAFGSNAKGAPSGFSTSLGLIEGADGAFYGTVPGTGQTGSGNAGSLFRITAAGAYTTQHQFCSQANCADGAIPFANLFLGSDGNMYGVTRGGGEYNSDCPSQGAYGCGTIFRYTPGGSLNTIYTACQKTSCADGSYLTTALLQANDGNFYGTAWYGGANFQCFGETGCGAAYRLSVAPALAPPVQLTLSAASVTAGSGFTLTYKVANATSLTLQTCYAASSANAAGWNGRISGSLKAQTADLVAPGTAGTYTYSLTCGGQESGFATLKVTPATGGRLATTTALQESPNPVTVGLAASLKATVTGGTATPTGTVSFTVDGQTLATGTLQSNGTYSLSVNTNGFQPGTYPVVAAYSGDNTYLPSTSAAVNVTLGPAPTSTTLAVSPNPVPANAQATLTATTRRSAQGATGKPGGKVTFYYGTAALGTANVNSAGVATLTASSSGVPAGSYPISARYLGDSEDSASTSPTVTVTIK